MGRPSKTKLLEILKQQQNLCANCSTPLEENFDRRISKIFTCSKSKNEEVEMGKEQNPPPSTIKLHSDNSLSELTLTEAIRTVFEAALKINKVTVSTSETTLYMCEQCASSLSNLYWVYKNFLEMSRHESYIRAVIKNCLLWKENCQLEKVAPSSSNESQAENVFNGEHLSTAKLNSKERPLKNGFLPDLNNSECEQLSNYASFENNLHSSESNEDYVPFPNTISNDKIKFNSKEAIPGKINIFNSKKIKIRKQIVSQRLRVLDPLPTVPTAKANKKKSPKSILSHSRTVVVSKTNSSEKPSKKLTNKIFKMKKKVSTTLKPSSKRNVSLTRESEKTLLCTTCGKKSQSPALLKLHITKCKKKVKYSLCRYCGKKFSLKLLRDRHENILHSKEVSTKGGELSCTECGKSFKNRTFLRRHASVHSSARPFKCETCGKAFKRFDTLQEHQRGKAHALSLGPKSRPHTGGKITYSCKMCDQSFKHKVTLFRHESKSHLEDRPFGCDKCWKRYRKEEKLANHQKSAHDNKKTKERVIYSCELCDKTYTYLYSYKAHVMTHEIDKPFLCSQCGKSFRQKQGFLRHVKTMHKPENRHTCEVCGKSFKRKDHLTQHLRGKTHGRPAKEGIMVNNNNHTTIKSESSSGSVALSSLIDADSSRIINHSSVNNQTKVIVRGTNSLSTTAGPRNVIVPETSLNHPPCNNNYTHQGNVYRPEVIVLPSVKTEIIHPAMIPANQLNYETTNNNQMQTQQPNFTFTASNLFFDF